MAQDDEYNINTVALILAHIMNEKEMNENMSSDEIEEVLSEYNGTGELAVKYGKVTIQYYEAFKKYNTCDID